MASLDSSTPLDRSGSPSSRPVIGPSTGDPPDEHAPPITTQAITLTEAHVVSWAGLTGDWYPLHMDDVFARTESQFGRRVVHGPLTFALGIGLATQTGVFKDSIVGWLGCNNITALHPVFIGDTVRVTLRLNELRESRSDPSRLVATYLYEITNQDDVIVMSYESVLLLKRTWLE